MTAYVPQAWIDGSSSGSAARFNYMEAGIVAADAKADVGVQAMAHSNPGASAASFDIQNLASTMLKPMHMKIVAALRSDRAASNTDAVRMRFNNISSASYYSQYSAAIAAAVTAGEEIAATNVYVGQTPGATATAGRYSSHEITIPYYFQAGDKFPGHFANAVPYGGSTGTIFWNSGAFCYDIVTGAISRVTIYPSTGPNFVAGSVVTIYNMPTT